VIGVGNFCGFYNTGCKAMTVTLTVTQCMGVEVYMSRLIMCALMSVLLTSWTAFGAPVAATTEDLTKVMTSIGPGASPVDIRNLQTAEGYFRYLGAPTGTSFSGSGTKSGSGYEDVAIAYVTEHYGAFGMKSQKINFATGKTKYASNRAFVHIKQTYNGVRVYAGTVIVQIDSSGGIHSVHADIMRDPRLLDSGQVSTTPTITADAASQAALQWIQAEYPGLSFTANNKSQLFVYDPSIVGETGPTRLVWKLSVASTPVSKAETVLVDAHSGQIVFHYTMIHEAKNREIFDAGNSSSDPGTLVRAEGSSQSGLADADNAYDFFGDTYDFYFNTHGRDSIDDNGLTMSSTVRFCDAFFGCPMQNAFWDDVGLRMYFGAGFSGADDVVGHELTHGVTQFESNLIYNRESGAINESFSDMWGEWIDLTNTGGTDNASVRWRLGEDVPGFGAIRDMKDPTLFGHPDRLGSPLYFTLADDNFGVHENSGIGNKLCYLLTDGTAGEPGGQFNGHFVAPMGIRAGDVGPGPGASELMYIAQTALLSPGSDYLDLGNAVLEAAVILGLDSDQRSNVRQALEAVELVEKDDRIATIRNLRATHSLNDFSVDVTWETGNIDKASGVILCRGTGSFVREPTPQTTVFTTSGAQASFTDGPLPFGTEVYYTLFILQPVAFCPCEAPVILVTDRQFARAVVGKATPDYQTETLDDATTLANSQILFSPSVDQQAAFLSGATEGYVNFTNYERTVVGGITELPITSDEVITLPPTDDNVISVRLSQNVPFFGSQIQQFGVSPAGYLTDLSAITAVDSIYGAATVYDLEELAKPTLSSHFDIPRVSFLLSKLSPATTGTRWAKLLDDRFVLTYVDVPQVGSTLPNTFQVELFTSGHIRITYLEVNTDSAIVGLSDGRGVPPGFTSSSILTNSVPDLLTLDPIGTQNGIVGQTIQFQVRANVPGGGSVTLLASGLPTGATFTPSGATASFLWTPQDDQSGISIVRFVAQTSTARVSQDVVFAITSLTSTTNATNLAIIPANPGPNDVLNATFGPQSLFNSGIVVWYRNGSLYVPYFDSKFIPAEATEVGDVFFFSVLENRGGSTSLFSDPVVIGSTKLGDVNQDGDIDATDIQLVINAALNKDLPSGSNADVSGDGKVDALDVQTVINAALQ
jgi:Zn-dependent metalloprotease